MKLETQSKTTNVLLAGVGGQGVILASELLALVAAKAGYDVKQTEVHGVAQRGGAVSSHVRFGEKVHSPLTKPGDVDFLVALEKLEALRYAHFVREGGVVVVNDYEIKPVRFPGDNRPYPKHALEFLKSKGFRVISVKATDKAIELGDQRVANLVLLGVLSNFLPIPRDVWEKTIEERIPERFLKINLKAFEIGRREKQ
jgi:indolepyruvate ferredoxin oxidoreductase beta subunit